MKGIADSWIYVRVLLLRSREVSLLHTTREKLILLIPKEAHDRSNLQYCSIIWELLRPRGLFAKPSAQ